MHPMNMMRPMDMMNTMSHLPCATRRNMMRPGVILLIVVVLLALFATIGLAFVLYATSAAEAARVFREAQSVSAADVPPEAVLDFFLDQLLFDVRDDESGIGSALRGHGL